jgi:hypothetical protein
MSDSNRPPKAVRINSWGVETDHLPHRSSIPMFGIFLIVLGLLLAAGQFFNVAALGASALFLALGIVLLLVWVRDRSDTALYVGLFITALALSDLLSAGHVISGDGWGTLFLGIGLLLVVPIRLHAGRSWGWTFVIGALLAVWGGSQVAAHYLSLPSDRLLFPVLLVLLGAYLVSRSMRGSRSS